MADLGAIRTALKTSIEAVPSLRVHETVPRSIEPGPVAAVLISPAPNFDQVVTVDGAEDVQLNVIVLTSNAEERSAQNRLDDLLDPLYTALTNSAGSAWDFTNPGVATGYGAYNFGSGDNVLTYFGFTVPVMVACS